MIYLLKLIIQLSSFTRWIPHVNTHLKVLIASWKGVNWRNFHAAKILTDASIANDITNDRAFDSYLWKDSSLELMYLRGQKKRQTPNRRKRVYKGLETRHTVKQMKRGISLGVYFSLASHYCNSTDWLIWAFNSKGRSNSKQHKTCHLNNEGVLLRTTWLLVNNSFFNRCSVSKIGKINKLIGVKWKEWQDRNRVQWFIRCRSVTFLMPSFVKTKNHYFKYSIAKTRL